MRIRTSASTPTHPNTHRIKTSGKENYEPQRKKCVLRADQKQWIKPVSLTFLGRAFHEEGALVAMYPKARWPCCLVLQSLGPRNIEKWLTPQAQRTAVEWAQLEWQFSKDRTTHNRKQLMENTVMHRQPVQLSEREADASTIMFSQPHHDHSCCVLDCLQLLICVCGSPTRRLLQ